jgi:hypothetical protein
LETVIPSTRRLGPPEDLSGSTIEADGEEPVSFKRRHENSIAREHWR